MTETALYQEMLVEALKNKLDAQAKFNNALRMLFDKKIAYIDKKVRDKMYNFDGTLYRVTYARYSECWAYYKTFDLHLTFLAVPKELRTLYKLTKTESKLVNEYEKLVYNELDPCIDSKKNDDLLGSVFSRLRWDISGCKNNIQLIETREWKFTLDKITDSTFVTNGLRVDDTQLL